jgi:hypothetical protein
MKKIIIIIATFAFVSCKKTELIPTSSFLKLNIGNKVYNFKGTEINKLGFGYSTLDFENDTLMGTINIPTTDVKDSLYKVKGTVSVPCIQYELRNATITFSSVKNSVATGTFYGEIIKQKSIILVNGIFENIILKH